MVSTPNVDTIIELSITRDNTGTETVIDTVTDTDANVDINNTVETEAAATPQDGNVSRKDGKNENPLSNNIVATTAIQHYYQVLPQKGKPTPGKEWTVYAAIVATTTRTVNSDSTGNAQESEACPREDTNAWVVACATGSKCTALQSALSSLFDNLDIPTCALSTSKQSTENQIQHQCSLLCQEQLKGMILHDSHAEVLARRGLMKVLLREINSDLAISEKTCEQTHNNPRMSRSLLHRVCSTSIPNDITYKLKHDTQLHLYISDSPCGDASIYDIAPVYNASKGNSDQKSNFTGAKIIMPASFPNYSGGSQNFTPCGEKKDPDAAIGNDPTPKGTGSIISIAREKTQIVSALRLKSGRSNLPDHLRSFSMSCSDKICKWMLLGLQGHGILNYFLGESIMLSSVVVSHDKRATVSSQKEALERALLRRAQGVLETISGTNQCEMNDLPPLPLLVELHICQEIFPQSKAEAEKEAHCAAIGSWDGPEIQASRKRKICDDKVKHIIPACTAKKQRQSPIGISINWQTSIYKEHIDERRGQFGVEQTVGAKGVKQGKKPKRIGDVMKCPSRLSRHALLQDSIECVKLLQKKGLTTKDLQPTLIVELIKGNTDTERCTERSYQTFKDGKDAKAIIFESALSPLTGWVRSSKGHDFLVCNREE